MARKAVFLDRDGTLIKNRDFDFRPDVFEFIEGVVEGLRLLQSAQFSLYVVTNQSGVARGLFSEAAVQEVHRRMEEFLGGEGVYLSGFYYCPHHPKGVVSEYAKPCDCRKPRPGLILRAATENTVDVTKSWLVGDIMDDVMAGRRAGCSTILVNGWYERLKHPFKPHPTFMARTFLGAVHFILARTT